MDFYQKGTSQYLQFIVLDRNGKAISGIAPGDVTVQIFRDSDNAYLDAASGVFVASGGNSEHEMSELGNTGVYRFLFDQTVDSDDKGVYTVLYTVKSPYEANTFDTMTFYDRDLSDIRGDGWDSAANKPTLMNLANKDANMSFAPESHSLQRIAEGTQLGSQENFNTEAF